jgi:hypothetical protein
MTNFENEMKTMYKRQRPPLLSLLLSVSQVHNEQNLKVKITNPNPSQAILRMA